MMRDVASVEEKGGVRREFAIDPLLREALEGAIGCNRGSPYVFPANRGIGRRSESQNDAWLRRLCARCVPPIAGSHVHVHALRRTTISMLLDAGNSLECVSRWIGHHSTEMARGCWSRYTTTPDPRHSATGSERRRASRAACTCHGWMRIGAIPSTTTPTRPTNGRFPRQPLLKNTP